MISLARPDLGGNESKYVRDTIKRGWLTSVGDYHRKFETALTSFLGRPTIATNAGTSAVTIALIAAGLKPDDDVIMPTLTFGTPASAVRMLGANVVLRDVEEDACLHGAILTRKTKVIMPTHLYGMLADIYYEHTVIEDSCEAFGIVKPRADYTCYSFYANKFITTGEGGALCGRDLEYCTQIRDGGFNEDYDMVVPGLNFCMTAMQAAVGVAQMERVHTLMNRRARNVTRYTERISGFGEWLYVARVRNPLETQSRLKALGVETRRVFKPLHLSKSFGQPGKFPVAEDIFNHGLCLPTGHVTLKEVEYICDAIKRIERGAQASKPYRPSQADIQA